MDALVLKETLNSALASASHAVATRTTLPALSTILLQTEGGNLQVSATNLSLGIVRQVGCKVTGDGALAIPARLLSEFVASLPNEPIHLETDDRARALYLQCGRYESEIKGLDPMEFPTIPEPNGEPRIATFTAAVLQEALNQTVFACSSEDTRPAMTGLNLTIRDKLLHLVGADGFRMAQRSIPLEEGGDALDIILPGKAAVELARLCEGTEGPVTLVLTPKASQAVFSGGTWRLVANLIEARFPDWTAIVPQRYTTRAFCPTAELLKAVRMVMLFTSKDRIVKLELQEAKDGPAKLCITADSEDGHGDATVDIALEGPESRIAFNGRYLVEAVNSIAGPELSLEMTEFDRPGVIRPVGRTDQLNVMMPMQL